MMGMDCAHTSKTPSQQASWPYVGLLWRGSEGKVNIKVNNVNVDFPIGFSCNGHQEGIPSELRLQKGILMDLVCQYNTKPPRHFSAFLESHPKGFIGGCRGIF